MTRLRLLAVLAAALFVAGCGGLTTDGPVQPGLEVGAEEAPSSNLRYIFPGPRDGDTPEDVVSGFLLAGAASDGLYDNARAFLTVSVAEQWNPDAELVLLADDSPPTTTLVDPTHVRVTASPAGTVDQSGRYTPAPPGAEVSAEFTLTDAGEEWRISELPEGFGRWIQAGYVSRLVQPYDLTYVSTSQRATVPDVRWFPLDKLATRLARAQLDPVPGYLEGAVKTAVPEGARLLGDAVSVDDSGLATVNIVGPRLDPDEATRQDLWAQFITTLNQDLSVGRVALSVNGTPVDLPGVDGTASSLADIGFPPRPTRELALPVVRRGAEVTVFDPAGSLQGGTQPGVGAYPPVPAGYTRLALSPAGAELAAVDPGGAGLSRWRDGTRYEVPGFGSDLGAPSYDRRGWLWAGGVGGGDDRLFVVDVAADPADPEAAYATAVPAEWLAGRVVEESRVSAGGDRVAVLVDPTRRQRRPGRRRRRRARHQRPARAAVRRAAAARGHRHRRGRPHLGRQHHRGHDRPDRLTPAGPQPARRRPRRAGAARGGGRRVDHHHRRRARPLRRHRRRAAVRPQLAGVGRQRPCRRPRGGRRLTPPPGCRVRGPRRRMPGSWSGSAEPALGRPQRANAGPAVHSPASGDGVRGCRRRGWRS